MLGMSAAARAAEPWIRASITGIGSDSYRLALVVHAPLWDGELPAAGDAISSVSIFAVKGDWNVPSNVVPAGHHRVLHIAAGDIVWGADWLAPALDSGFDLTMTAASIQIEYSCVVEYFLHTQATDGRDCFTSLGMATGTGSLAAPLPAVGETAWLGSVPAAVTTSTWGGVKELFRGAH